MSVTITIKPRQVAKKLLAAAPNDRSRDVLVRRFGIGKSTSPETLDSIGKSYGITRERVRQIENNALTAIQKSDLYKELEGAIAELTALLDALGGVVAERELVAHAPKSPVEQNSLVFLLAAGEPFKLNKENKEFVHHWYLDDTRAERVMESLRNLYTQLDNDVVLPESDMVATYRNTLREHGVDVKDDDTLLRWITLSKKLDKNPLGEWGLASSPSVAVRGMRDLAFLTMRQHGQPMHFSEVAQQINQIFGRKAHVATTHNELIKDPRFVLVGRGLYALADWGYVEGVVRDVIRNILEHEGTPLSKSEIIERVKRERYVKDNTIAVNLQDTNLFRQLDDGRYELV